MGLIFKVEFISKNCEFDYLNSQVQIWQWPPTQIMVMNVILSQQLSKKCYNSSLWLVSNGTREYDVDGYKLNVWTKKEDFSGKRFLVEPGFWGSNTMTEFGSRANLVSLDVSLLHCISMFTRFAYMKITLVTTRIEYLRNKNDDWIWLLLLVLLGLHLLRTCWSWGNLGLQVLPTKQTKI